MSMTEEKIITVKIYWAYLDLGITELYCGNYLLGWIDDVAPNDVLWCVHNMKKYGKTSSVDEAKANVEKFAIQDLTGN